MNAWGADNRHNYVFTSFTSHLLFCQQYRPVFCTYFATFGGDTVVIFLLHVLIIIPATIVVILCCEYLTSTSSPLPLECHSLATPASFITGWKMSLLLPLPLPAKIVFLSTCGFPFFFLALSHLCFCFNYIPLQNPQIETMLEKTGDGLFYWLDNTTLWMPGFFSCCDVVLNCILR